MKHMAKKVNAMFEAELIKNQEKGGAWLGEFSVVWDDMDEPSASGRQAFSNASAGKRWLKAMVLANTTKKSIKMVASDAKDIKDKPVHFTGSVAFKIIL
jgi:hypothetical protein